MVKVVLNHKCNAPAYAGNVGDLVEVPPDVAERMVASRGAAYVVKPKPRAKPPRPAEDEDTSEAVDVEEATARPAAKQTASGKGKGRGK